MNLWLFLLLFIGYGVGVADSAPLSLGLGLDPVEGGFLADEWAWALRGGGAEFRRLELRDLVAPAPDLPLIVLDSIPLNPVVRQGLDAWVRRGGLLIYAGAPAALQDIDEDGQIHNRRDVAAPELFGVRFGGFDPGLTGTYPDIVRSSALLSPLLPGDALRLGDAGVGHNVRLEAAGADVLARGARLSPGPDGRLVLKSDAPTILSRKHGNGRVIFLSFSPGQVAACYPDFRRSREPRDCSGAGSAHALMRWLTANLLWEERHLQIPLLWETPGDRPHGFIVTGDVHDYPPELKSAYLMAKLFDGLHLPLSLYLYGNLAQKAPSGVEVLRRFKDLEISTHSVEGKVYTSKKFGFRGIGAARGILSDIREAEDLLRLPRYPEERQWLVSTRSHGWLSDRNAWEAMHRAGIGLAFDQVADQFEPHTATPWRVPAEWFAGGEQRRLFVPIYERSISSTAGDFRLSEDRQRNIANLASGQPDPVSQPMPYRVYSDYVQRWHGLFNRLATVGGLTEVWLWHPGGVGTRQGFGDMERMLRSTRDEESVSFVRGDVAANWHANRERYRIQAERDAAGAIAKINLLPPDAPPLPLPPQAPAMAASTSYWVIGPLEVPGWSSRRWSDPMGRTITVLMHSLAQESR